MAHLGKWLILGAAIALSGCAAPLAATSDAPGEVRLLTDTLTAAPRATGLGEDASASADQRPAAATIELTIDETDSPRETADQPPVVPGPAIVTESADMPEPPTGAAATISDAAPTDTLNWQDAPTRDVAPPQTADLAWGEAPASDDAAPRPAEMPVQYVPEFSTEAAGDPSASGALASDPPQHGIALPREPARPAIVMIEETALAPDEAEMIETPSAEPRSPFKPGPDEGDYDRFARSVMDVPVDIRPTEGAMPEDLAAARFAAEPTIDETLPSVMPADVFCKHTPWVFCYRPLYFEDIHLERYGENIGYAQTGLSGVRFFGSILALPYKMTVRPPRSCQCSNGFSRCGDCPLPGYGRREFRWDASLVEAAAVAGVVYILP